MVCATAAGLLGGTGLEVSALGWLATMNLLLGVFNLLPGAPLDGGRLVRALLWWRTRPLALPPTRRPARDAPWA